MYSGYNLRYPPTVKIPQMRSVSYYPFFLLSPSFPMKDKRRIPAPPKYNIMYSSRYKTEICRQYEEIGRCEYGDRCLFAHGLYELRQLPNRHPKHKTEICNAFQNQGFCTFGPRCSFIHQKVDVETLVLNMQCNPEPIIPMLENPNHDNCNGIGDCYRYNMNQGFDQLVNEVDVDTIMEELLKDGKRLPIFMQIASQSY